MPTVQSTSIFATALGGAKSPDSITSGNNSIWVEYGDSAKSDGSGGSSTVVQYDLLGNAQNTYTLPGLVDGLKVDPTTGDVWALQNQDGNSTVTLIDPATKQVSAPLSYAPPYTYGADSTRGYDDVAFVGQKAFLSYTNPVNPGDPVVQQLTNGTAPFGSLQTTDVLRFGDTGTNLVTGETNQPLPLTDPDSLKSMPDGSLILTGEADKAFTIIANPGTTQQSASFVTLPAGSASPDDVIMPTTTSGTFYVSNQNDNNILAIKVDGLNTNDLYASVGTSVDQIDPATGTVTPIVTGLNAAHGLLFMPAAPGAPDLTTLFQTLSQDLYQAFANLGVRGPSRSVRTCGDDPRCVHAVGRVHHQPGRRKRVRRACRAAARRERLKAALTRSMARRSQPLRAASAALRAGAL